ncbi:MAG: hypothetical protein LBR48_00260 [Dysgonamonadaceae bacterium]|jgi:hypothetical protein|nr:hypothetical protein [Dysgonamonadaceae bacterium]
MVKRLFISMFFVAFFYLYSNAQFNPYVELKSGVAANHKDTGMLAVEFGTTYKWLDVALYADIQSNNFWKEYSGEVNIHKEEGYNPNRNHNADFGYFTNTSLQMVAKIDIVRLFATDSRHSLKVGGGYGVIRYQKAWSKSDFPDNSSVEYNLTTKSDIGRLGSLYVSYGYKVKPKLIVGTYFGGTYYPSIGLSLRRNF